MKELRCKKCNKLLGKYNGDVEIKCSRCKTINVNKKIIQKHYDATNDEFN